MPKTSAPSVSLWIQLYYVLASLLGLGLTALGSIMLLNVLLSSTVLKVERRYSPPPPQPAIATDRLQADESLTDEQRQALQEWEQDYKTWQDEQRNVDWEAQSRKELTTTALSFLITGLPIFALHAPWIFRRQDA